MSRSFLHYFTKIFKETLNNTDANITLKIVGIGSICNLGYTFGTKKKREIVVAKKYQYDSNGFTNFMIVDEKGNHYNVNNSLWFMKWDSIEDWASVEANDSLSIKFYGWRVPFLGIFPKIVATNKNLNSNFKVVLEKGTDGFEPVVKPVNPINPNYDYKIQLEGMDFEVKEKTK